MAYFRFASLPKWNECSDKIDYRNCNRLGFYPNCQFVLCGGVIRPIGTGAIVCATGSYVYALLFSAALICRC